MKIKVTKNLESIGLSKDSVLYDCIELETGYYEGVHYSSSYGHTTIAVPKDCAEIINDIQLINCYCGLKGVCDCDPPLPKPKQFTDKEKVNFFHNMLIDLHTFRWTGDGEKVKRVLDAIGGYSYTHTNGNFYDDEDKYDRAYERLVSTINEIVNSPASWKEPKKELDDSITKDTLKMDGWVFTEKSPWTGKPTWNKNLKVEDSALYQVDIYEFSLTLDDYQGLSTIHYSGGEFSTIKRKVETMQQVKDFVKVLG